MSRGKVGLRTRLFYLAAAAFLPLALMSGIGLLALAEQQRKQAERAGIEITRALSTAVDAELSRSLAVLEAMATSTLLDRVQPARIDELARRIAVTRPQWRAVILHDAKGRMIFNSAYPLDAPLPQTAERASLELVLSDRTPAIGDLARGRQGAYSFALRVPVMRDGELRYVLSAIIGPEGIRDVINRQRVPGDWVVSVFDAKAQRIARSRPPDLIGGPPAPGLKKMMDGPANEGAAMTATIEGDLTHTAFTRSVGSGWTVAIGIPPSYVDAGALRSLIVYGGGMLLSIGLAALAALIVARGIARPMAEVSAAARALGRREGLELPDTPIEEIRQLAESLAVAADERARGEAEREQLLEREQQARAIAETANRSKDEFLAMLGHELRNPLGAIANASHLLDAAPDAETRAHAQAVISRQVQHLARMTDDLLDAARAMTGKIVLQRQPLDLAEAAARALSTLRAAGRTGRRRLAQQLEPV